MVRVLPPLLVGVSLLSLALPAQGQLSSRLSNDHRFPLPDSVLEEYRKFGSPACPCSRPELCKPITSKPARETFGFYGHSVAHIWNWTDIPFGTVTSVAFAPYNVSEFLCTAHEHNTRMIAGVRGFPLNSNPIERKEWVDKVVMSVKANYFDGVNFDYESPLRRDEPKMLQYIQVINDTRNALRKEVGPGVQVSVDVAWSPRSIDGRDYAWKALAESSDYLYVMDYDTRGQVYGRCVAGPNAPVWGGADGVAQFMELGVPKEKLIWGVPWYGYIYTCLNGTSPTGIECPIKPVSSGGVNCSDAAGKPQEYSAIQEVRWVDGKNATEYLDEWTQSNWFKYQMNGVVYQVWYDGPEAVRAKAKESLKMGLGGWGPFTWQDLDELGKTNNPYAPAQARAIWKVVEDYHNGRM